MNHEQINAVHLGEADRKKGTSLEAFGVNSAKKAYEFHRSFPEYKQTPLVELKDLVNYLGVKSVWVKDESYRFNLNAFKVLGGSYCIGKYIESRFAMEDLGDVTFVTATDGNHGRGIAWAVNRMGYKSVVYMPKGSAAERLSNIKSLGAEAFITDMNYDDTVRYAAECAEKYGWVLVQDTAWEGYTTIPKWIMQGYTTMAYEILEQLDSKKPTHIFLQAGVGAMAGAITGFFADAYSKEEKPIITIVEPNKADCIYKTAKANDDKHHIVTEDMDTIMAGLACGEPCSIGWDILHNYADNFISTPDYVAAKGMRILGNPIGDDKRIVSGESGAVTLGIVAEVMMNKKLLDLQNKLGVNKESRILCISTEGDTDQVNYRDIVWDGKYQSF